MKIETDIDTTWIELPSLTDKVSIRRDERGVPYIDAANEKDLYFAQGYATASDRLWQMDFLRRTARGELSEILGPGALELDKLHRIYGFTAVAEKLLERASMPTRNVLESYASGVNAFINQCSALPLEFRILNYQPASWSPVDSLVLGKLFAEKLSFTAETDILRALLSDLSPEKLEVLLPKISPLDVMPAGNDALDEHNSSNGPGFRERRKFTESEISILTELLRTMHRLRVATSGDGEVGSNSWVVSGERTVSGKPMLASDPHLPPTSPSIWHIVHLSAGDFRVGGVSVPGIPGVMIGHNERIAWGITNLCPDVQDLYIEQFDANGLYNTPSGWRTAEVRREEISVRKSSDGSQNELVTCDIKVTRHGPVVIEQGSLGLALRWTALDAEIIDLDTFIALNHARNWDDFTKALSGYGGPPQNFTYADTAGHIGFHSAGGIPIRRTGDGRLPYHGVTDEGEWIGFIPFEKLPYVFDPPAQIVIMANQRIVGGDYPYHLTDNWRVPYRAQRIYNRLQSKQKFDLADFLSIQGDTYSYPDAIFAAELVKLAAPFVTSSEEWREIAEIFDGWEAYSTSESTPLALVTEMRQSFRRHILEAAIGTELTDLFEWRNEGTFLDQLITERPTAWLPAGFTSYEALILVCYREAVNALSTRFGSDRKQWTWGRVAQVRFPHPLERIPSVASRFATASFPQNTGGSMPTVNAGSRVSMRFIADLSDGDSTRLCLPLGQSGDPASAHRQDQLDEWRNVAPSAFPFTHDAIAAATQTMLVLTPSARESLT